MASTSDFSAEQLAAARALAWHQDGKALLTIEGARSWVNHYGLVAFAPVAKQLGAPAASFVEATMGAANEAPSAEESSTARSLAARLLAEGTAVPLNLLGGGGEAPDFLASAQVFSYVYTMRGDKTWKQAPSTSDGAKVSPLAVKVWEALTEKGAMTTAELVSELGREVTGAAIQRALNELWAQMRVIPQGQADDAPTLWELTSKRFAKAVKAGVNAGQPTALSALLSLYLAQAVAATEEEAAGFLSPLTARSRVRDVVHALTAGRQLDATVVEGKTLLHVSGSLPEFAEVANPEGAEGAEEAPVKAPKVGTGRIAKFEAGAERKPRADFKGKPTAGSFAAKRAAGPRAGGERPARPFAARPDRERRPFSRNDEAKPSFTKPWDEDKRPRMDAAEGGEAPRERRTYAAKPAFGAKKSFGAKPFGERKSFGDRKPFGAAREGGPRKTFGARPAFGEGAGAGERPARPRREDGGEGFTPRERPSYPRREGEAPRERKSFGAKPFRERKAFGDRKPFGERKSFGAKPGFDRPDRPARPRREEGEGASPRSTYPKREGTARSYERKPFVKREGGDERPRRSFDREGGAERPRSFDVPKKFGAKPGGFSNFSKPDGDRKPFRKREDGESAGPARPARPAFGSKPAYGAKPAFGAKPRFGAKPGFGAGKPAGKFGAKPGGKFGAKPGGKFGAKPGGKFGSKPGGPFKKRASGPAPATRKPKPGTEE